MWTHDTARYVVAAYVEAVTSGGGVILDKLTIDKPYGWVFFYNSKRYVETGDELEAYGGNAPLIFNRDSGEYTVTGTARPVEFYIQEYESKLPPEVMRRKPQLRRRDAEDGGNDD